jgi:uncharacterized protein (DUF2336 family)
MTSTALSLIAELDSTISKAPVMRQAKILESVADLFLDGTMAFSAEHVALFDDVIRRLMEKADNATLTKLGKRLAVSGYTLTTVFNKLARHEDIAIAGPVLELAPGLGDGMLAEVAGAKGPKHLTAISRRNTIGDTVTDILIERGNPEMALKLAGNPHARLSEMAFVKLINKAKSDKALADAIAARNDLPEELLPFLNLALAAAPAR